MTSQQQSIEDRTHEYRSRIEQRIERLQTAYNTSANIIIEDREPAHSTLENANLTNDSTVHSDPVFLKLYNFYRANIGSYGVEKEFRLIANRINDEISKLRKRTMNEKTYTSYQNAPESELGKLIMGDLK